MVTVDAIQVMSVMKETTFQKEKLDEQLKLHNISRDQLLRETLGKDTKTFANWKVKWSRLINKGVDDPSNFGLLELSKLFSILKNRKVNVTRSPGLSGKIVKKTFSLLE